ncbi:hypothetical protein WT97_07230 [Burkholderia sp. MSMB1459WGS]|nr:hypothetical protein WT97_07230 [Burkholderia sp. MSMB1459WGS]
MVGSVSLPVTMMSAIRVFDPIGANCRRVCLTAARSFTVSLSGQPQARIDRMRDSRGFGQALRIAVSPEFEHAIEQHGQNTRYIRQLYSDETIRRINIDEGVGIRYYVSAHACARRVEFTLQPCLNITMNDREIDDDPSQPVKLLGLEPQAVLQPTDFQFRKP